MPLPERLRNIHISRNVLREPKTGKWPFGKKIGVYNQTLDNDVVVRAFPKTGPIEIVIQQVEANGGEIRLVEGGHQTTRIIEPGEKVNIGKHFMVGVRLARRYTPPKNDS